MTAARTLAPLRLPSGADGRPVMANDWADVRAVAETALKNREQAWPGRVARGQMTAADADADLAAWRAIVAEWTWIDTQGRDGHPAPADILPDLIAAVDRMITNTERQRDPRDGHSLTGNWATTRCAADAIRHTLTTGRARMAALVNLNTECRRRVRRDQQQDQNLCQAA